MSEKTSPEAVTRLLFEDDETRDTSASDGAKNLVIVVGPSGAGKRTAIGILEDLFDYSAVTKLRPGQLTAHTNLIAARKLVFDVPFRPSGHGRLESESAAFVNDCVLAFRDLAAACASFRILFLYCAQRDLANRQTVGYHTLKRACGTLKAAIFKECETLIQLFCKAAEDPLLVQHLGFLDSSGMSPMDLRVAIERQMAIRGNPAQHSAPFVTRGWNRMRTTLDEVERVRARFRSDTEAPPRKSHARYPLNCLIQGASGVGKEVVATYLAGGADKLTAISCTEFQRDLLDSELFGHTDEAYTGAKRVREGILKQADGGTLFVDEIGLAPDFVQAKLLRFIEKREYRRVGEDKTAIHVSCRVIAAARQNLEEEVKRGAFLEDLYHRLSAVTIDVPMLQQRREDIPLLLKHYIEGPLSRFAPEALTMLFDYSWPGNVRELTQVMDHCSYARVPIRATDLPSKIAVLYDGLREYQEHMNDRLPQSSTVDATDAAHLKLNLSRREDSSTSKRYDRIGALRTTLIDALTKAEGNISKAAVDTHVSRATFYRQMKAAGLQPPRKTGKAS